ncbi:MAG: helix-turn-helix domain-containing protein [Verrucomicrobia bacterium]|nr:helix-turn-helix domain-containing protein [Verrucomicrobiota bacterium]
MTPTTPVQIIQPRYLDVKAAAAYLGTTAGAIYAAVARRQIPFRRLGAKLVFDRQELDAYMHGLEGVDVAEAVSRTLNDGTVAALPK